MREIDVGIESERGAGKGLFRLTFGHVFTYTRHVAMLESTTGTIKLYMQKWISYISFPGFLVGLISICWLFLLDDWMHGTLNLPQYYPSFLERILIWVASDFAV